MTTNVQTIDQIIRERARKALQKEVERSVTAGLSHSLETRSGKYRQLKLTHSDLVIIDNGPQAGEEERYVVKILVASLAELLVRDGIEMHAPEVEQRAVDEFVERLDSVSEEIQQLREGVES